MNRVARVCLGFSAGHVVVDLARAYRAGRVAGGCDGALSLRRSSEAVIIVPVWNDASVLARCIRALAWEVVQRGPRTRVVIVAGGMDGSYSLACELASEQECPDRWSVLPQGPEGKNAALNKALDSVGNAVGVVVDADTEVQPGWLDAILGPIEGGEADATTGQFVSFQRTHISAIYECEQTFRQAVKGAATLFGGGTIALSPTALAVVGGRLPADVLVGVDWDLSERLRRCGMSLRFVPQARVRTEIPATWREHARNQVRWRRAHFACVRRFAPEMSLTDRFVGLIYVPAVYAAVLGGWLPAHVFWGKRGRRAWVALVGWVIGRSLSPCFAEWGYSGQLRSLNRLPAFGASFVVSAGAAWAAILTPHRATRHFKGPRPAECL